RLDVDGIHARGDDPHEHLVAHPDRRRHLGEVQLVRRSRPIDHEGPHRVRHPSASRCASSCTTMLHSMGPPERTSPGSAMRINIYKQYRNILTSLWLIPVLCVLLGILISFSTLAV